MKRFLSAIFISCLLLCGHVSQAQEKANPPTKTTTLNATDKSDEVTNPTPEGKQNQPTKQDDNPASKKTAMDERMADIAQEANDFAFAQTIIGAIGLAFVIAATVFAGLAWRAGKKGVEVTEKIGKKQTKAYLSMSEARFVIDSHGWPKFKVKIKNTGHSPANNVGITDLAYKLDLAVWQEGEEFPKEILRAFSDAVSDDYRLILPDIMSGETLPCDNASILPNYDFSIINAAISFHRSGTNGVTSVEVVCNLEYTDVFNEKFILPCRFLATSHDRGITDVALDVLSGESTDKVKELSKAYKDNTYNKRIVAAGLRSA